MIYLLARRERCGRLSSFVEERDSGVHMMRCCLSIGDEALLERLEYFIYDVSGLEYNGLEMILNYSLGNKADSAKLRTREDVYALRTMLSCCGAGERLEGEALDRAVDLFLRFLRTYNMEASLCLKSLLDSVWQSDCERECVKRLSGVLAAVFLLYFTQRAKLLGKAETERNMRVVYEQNLGHYTLEDRRFLSQLFLVEKRFDCIVILLGADLKGGDWREGECAVSSEDELWKEFYTILRRLKTGKGYQDALILFQESGCLFNKVRPEVKGWWEKERAGILFRLGQYEEAKNILDRYVERPEGGANVYDLFDDAVNYAWAANFKEKDDPDWKAYIEKAYGLTLQAEELIVNSGALEFMHYDVIFEKEFLLSEMGEYGEAYGCFARAFSNADEDTREKSNFNTHLWILMKYMCLKPELQQEILGWIDSFYKDYDHAKLDRYRPIVEFINTNVYLKGRRELWGGIYANLMELLFHAMEIRHETKIRDISKYDFLYYTNGEHLRLLLEDETTEHCHYRLPIFHASNMNDPQEGKLLQDILKQVQIPRTKQGEDGEARQNYQENYVFLKSFFCYRKDKGKAHVKEFLPMWVQYGEDAAGCCVVLNNKTFGKTNLRKVVYLSDEGKCGDGNVQKFLNGFIDTYKRLWRLCGAIDEDSVQGRDCLLKIASLAEMILSQISYLFKHDSYRHENEVRLIVNRTGGNLEDVKVVRGKTPKIYIYHNRQSYIDEIILGAKMERPEDYVPFIHKQGHKMWSGTDNQIRVTHSTIQYR